VFKGLFYFLPVVSSATCNVLSDNNNNINNMKNKTKKAALEFAYGLLTGQDFHSCRSLNCGKIAVFAIMLIVAMLTTALTTHASAKKYFVGITTPWTTYDGHYADVTASNLIAAVKAADINPGIDTIYAGVGRYFLTEELNLSDVLLGGYQNGETHYYPASDSAGSGSNLDKMTVLDGNSLRTTVDTLSNSLKHRVATINAGGVIDGCLIRNGHARSTTTDANAVKHGGGILVKGGSVYNCILRGNVAFNPAGSSFTYDSTTPLNSIWTTSAPAKGGAVYVDKEGGNVVNCLIYSNMDDLGLGIDCADNGLINDVYIINNTIVNNANCPRMASLISPNSFKILGNNISLTEINNAYTLSRYYISSTETTCGQYSCFLNAIDVTVTSDNMVYINVDDLSALLSDTTYAPLSGHAKETVNGVLSIGTAVKIAVDTSPSNRGWNLYWFLSSGKTNEYGQLYYINPGKIFASGDISSPTAGESNHHNDYACSYVSWYGGIAYSVWMGGMLPTIGQWYYAACATDTNGSKAALSHYPSPVLKTNTPLNDNVSDVLLESIAWYHYNAGNHVHQVAKKAPNNVGLYDMSGNLREQCLDWYGSGYYTGGLDGVCVVLNASYRRYRGSYWGQNPYNLSLGYNDYAGASGGSSNIGFRLCVLP
jgi:formylglycine-generating enzyme required for sulfatase activity